MNNTKRQKMTKSAPSKQLSSGKKSKEEPLPDMSHESFKKKKDIDLAESTAINSNNRASLLEKKKKTKKDQKNQRTRALDNQQKFKKLIDYDEYKEVTDFLKSLDKGSPKWTPNKKVKMEVENEFDILRRESKRLSKMAFGLFDKIGLSFDNFRRPGATSTMSSAIKPKPTEHTENVTEEPKKMEIEEKKEEQQAPKPRLKDLLKVDLFLDYDGRNDDQLAHINFEPTLEMMRTSNHIDLDMVAPLIERKKDLGKSDKDGEDVTPRKVSLENLSESYQKINELVEGISEMDLQRLEPEVYLNDTLINFYLKFIELGLISAERRNKIHIFNTYFMPKMRKLFNDVASDFSKFEKVYEKLERWTRRIDLFEKDFILIPINENEHWDMLVLCYPAKLYSKDSDFPYIVYLDSLCRMDDVYAKMLYNFFIREVKAKKPNEYPTLQEKITNLDSSSFPYYQPMVPKQSNWTDCGLYLLQYTEMFAEDDSFILKDVEELNKTRWFPRKLISDKREDMKKLIKDLKAHRYEAINEYIERRNKRLRDYAKNKDQYDTFDKKGFDLALSMKYNGDYLTEEEIAIMKLDFYYFGSLEFDQTIQTHG